MSRPCVCQGSNENCRYCYGRGFVPDTQALPLKNAYTRVRHGKTGGHRPLVQCPQCGNQVSRLQKHLKKCQAPRHLVATEQNTVENQLQTDTRPASLFSRIKAGLVRTLSGFGSSPKQSDPAQSKPTATRADLSPAVLVAKSKANPKLTKCPRCGETFGEREKFEAHWTSRACAVKPLLNLKPGQSSVAVKFSTKAASPSRTGNSEILKKCPGCGANVKAKKLPRHIRLKCPNRKRGANLPRSSPMGRRQTSVSLGMDHDSSNKKRAIYDQVQSRDRLDATKPYAHPYREQGRFGSHPSHDGFDDESSP